MENLEASFPQLDVPLDLTPKQRKDLQVRGFRLEKKREIFYRKCENQEEGHLCSECTKKRTKNQYIIRAPDFVSEDEKAKLLEINHILEGFEAACKQGKNYTEISQIKHKGTIPYLKSQGFRVLLWKFDTPAGFGRWNHYKGYKIFKEGSHQLCNPFEGCLYNISNVEK